MAVVNVHTLFVPGVIGYVADWNVPASAHGMWAWAATDLSPWLPTEYGLPLAYPTDLYAKMILGVWGLLGLEPQIAIALFLTACIALGFTGISVLTRTLWKAPLAEQLAAGMLYATSPALFDALVTGYITFIFAYAAMPWMALCLVRALRGERSGWFGYAFFAALTLAQIQFAILDIALTAALVIALGSLRAYLLAPLFFLLGMVTPYLFVLVNVLGTPTLIERATIWSAHSWTSLNAPGLLKALMLVPSAYPYFDIRAGHAQELWRAFAVLMVLGALLIGARSRLRSARVLAILLVCCLIFLHGPNPPLTHVMTWFLNLGPLAVLRNVNYVYALVAVLVPVLLTAPLDRGRTERVWYTACLGAFAVIWSLPWLINTYAVDLSPIPGPSDTQTVVGSANRSLVLPHLQVIDSRRPTIGGVNPNSVGTITPIFVRDTPTGALEASILDRLTDWQPNARTFGAALRAAQVNAVALQTRLDSTFPRFTNAYTDLWLLDAYRTRNIEDRLAQVDSVHPNRDGTTTTYEATPGDSTGFQTADAALALNGGLEDEIALGGIGVESIYIPANQLANPRAPWVAGLVQGIGAPPLVPSPVDVRDHAYLPAGIDTDHRTSDFHVDWVDPMDSVNWWYSARLMSNAHAAITQGVGQTFSIPVPSGRRHVWLQYYASVFGDSLRFTGAVLSREIRTRTDSFGAFQWLDLGWTNGEGNLLVTGVRGFNAIGDVYMLNPQEIKDDQERFNSLRRIWFAEVKPNVSLDREFELDVPDGWHPEVVVGNPSNAPAFFAESRLRHDKSGCTLMIRDVQFRSISVSLDGRPVTGGGSFFPAAATACNASKSGIARLTSQSRILPLALPPLRAGHHVLRFAQKPIFDAQRLRFVASKPVTTRSMAFKSNQRAFIVGSYAASSGSMLRLRLSHGDVDDYALDLQGGPMTRDYHIDLSAIRLHPDERLNVSYYPVLAPQLVTLYVLEAQVMPTISYPTIANGTITGGLQWTEQRSPATGDPVYTTTLKNGRRVYVGPDNIPFVGRASAFFGDFGKRGALISPVIGPGRAQRVEWSALITKKLRTLSRERFVPKNKNDTAEITIQSVERSAANLLLLEPGSGPASATQLHPHSLGFERYDLEDAGRVIQYDQTYDRGWGLSGGRDHYASTSGFNVWTRDGKTGRTTISYRVGVVYAIAVAVSIVALCALGTLAIPLFWRQGPRDHDVQSAR